MSLTAIYSRFGTTRCSFECCDTTFTIKAIGPRATRAVEAARTIALELEAQLNAFEEASAVATLNRTGVVENEHVARLVRRGLEYYERTDGQFDIHQGAVEHEVKTYIDDRSTELNPRFTAGDVSIDGETVRADQPLDLNGLAKGYMVDRANREVSRLGTTGFVDGGGDMSSPTGPVEIESPFGDRPLRILDTDWNIATSGGYRRRRASVDHIYSATDESIGSRNDIVTVVARRDCTEADALATTLASLPGDDAIALAEDWDGAEAFLVSQGIFQETSGFETHLTEGKQ